MARRKARITFDNDLLYRRWSAKQGGVYVRVSEDTPPNPCLQVPDRDVTTTPGLSLTLVNPAYMARQVHDLADASGGSRVHLTSLKPLRPENAPDAWEAAALRSFEQGVPGQGMGISKERVRQLQQRASDKLPSLAECHNVELPGN